MQIPAPGSWLRQRRWRALIAGTLLCFCNPAVGHAEAQDAPTLDTSACNSQSRERLTWLVERTESRERYADLWWRGWFGFYGLGTVIQSTRAGFEDDKGKRVDLIVGAVKALGGTTRLYFYRPVARLGADPLLAEPLPDEEACVERVKQGEALLKQAAKESQNRWDLRGHIGNLAVNLFGAVIVTQGFDQKSGWTSAALGIAVGEAQLWSHPWHGKSDLEEYETRFGPPSTPRVSWMLMPYERGLRVAVRF